MDARGLFDNRVRYFIAVVETGSFSAAARKLYVSQPAVSQQISSLENSLGTRLFDRAEYRPKLTSAGSMLYKSLCSFIESESGVLKTLGVSNGRISVGFTGSHQNRELLEFTKNFRREHSDIDIVFQKGNFDEGKERLLKGEVDCAFSIDSVFEGVPGIEMLRLYDYHICVICSHDNKLASRASVCPEDLAGQPFLVLAPRYGKQFNRMFMGFLAADGIRPRVVHEVDSFDELVFGVSIGEGIALVAPNIVNANEVAAIPLEGTKAKSSYVVAWKAGAVSSCLGDFLDAAKIYFEDWCK